MSSPAARGRQTLSWELQGLRDSHRVFYFFNCNFYFLPVDKSQKELAARASHLEGVWDGPVRTVNELWRGAWEPSGRWMRVWKGEGQRGCPPGAGGWGQRPALGMVGRHAGRLAAASPDLQGCPFLGSTTGGAAELRCLCDDR